MPPKATTHNGLPGWLVALGGVIGAAAIGTAIVAVVKYVVGSSSSPQVVPTGMADMDAVLAAAVVADA